MTLVRLGLLLIVGACGGAPAEPAAPISPPISPPVVSTVVTQAEPEASAPAVASCSGTSLELAALQSCTVPYEERDPPPPEHLAIEVATPQPVPSGGELGIEVRLENRHTEAISLHIDLQCSGFETAVLDGEGRRVDLVDANLLFGALCGREGLLRVTLLPGGRLRTVLPFDAVRTTYRCEGDGPCERVPVGPLDAGTYTLRVVTPIQDCRSVDGGRHCTPRTSEVPLRVTAS